MEQIANYRPEQDHNDQHLDPALQQSNEITTAPGGFNAFPVHFQCTDAPVDIINKEDSPSSMVVVSPMDGVRPGSHVGGAGSSSGRTSVMLGEGGKPIPEDQKPPPGTEAYAKMRKVNHKEVERKRRQTINEGLDELAKLIASPHAQPEKNKGAVLQKACTYINELKRNENSNIEKYTMDKLLCDQQIAELRGHQEQLYQQLHLNQQRAELWKAAASGDENARAQAKALDSQ